MRLILARHGNTFNPGDKITWVGSSNDLPLVERGIEQAESVGDALKGTHLAAAYCAPLLRTKEFAEIAVKRSGNNIACIVDTCLTELDYGEWSGLSDAEITDKFGEQCLKDWMNSSVWPKQCGWTSDQDTVRKQVEQFVSEIIKKYPDDSNVLVVSSNGRLRYFLHLVAGEFDKRVTDKTFKVATGRVCVLETDGKIFELKLWDEKPELLKTIQ